MKKWLSICILNLLGLLLISPSMIFAESLENNTLPTDMQMVNDRNEGDDDDDCIKDVNFNDKQTKRLNKLYDDLYDNYNKLFDAYEEYGAISKEYKEKKLGLLKRYHEKVRTHHYRWCEDDDDWEEIED